MHIDWATLVRIAVVAAAAALAVILLVAFAVVGWSADSRRGVHGQGDAGPAGTRAVAGTTLTALCLFAAGLIVCYALYLIIA